MHFALCNTPVSYTHLDVYKRQGVDGVENMTQEEYRKAAVDAVKKLSADVGIPADLKEILKPEDVDFLSPVSYTHLSLTENVESEMNLILTVAVIMIFAVLCISTTAWSEPFLFLLVMGVAILLNRGTNIFIGTVSFLTNNVAMVLQLATSMDYSIFLLDAFSREKQKGLSEEQAMINAIDAAINSIFASSLTTVVGFLASVSYTHLLSREDLQKAVKSVPDVMPIAVSFY